MRRVILALAIAGTLCGCGTAVPPGGGGGGAGSPVRGLSVLDMTGTWTIAYRLNPPVGTFGLSLDGYLHLTQSGTTITGTYTRDRNPRTYPVTGTVTGRVVHLTVGPFGIAVGTTASINNQATIDATGAYGTGPANGTVTSSAASLQVQGTADVARLSLSAT